VKREGRETPNIEHRTSNIEHRTLNPQTNGQPHVSRFTFHVSLNIYPTNHRYKSRLLFIAAKGVTADYSAEKFAYAHDARN